jgi:tRNA threonylcarbamoyladenosine biosynthesis protein TsaE
MQRELHLPDAAATRALGVTIGERAFAGAVVLLHGELGAGKTGVAQGIAAGLGVRGPVQSPTFVLVAEYPDAMIPLRHADLYRIDNPSDVEHSDVPERVGVDGVWVVEWPERAPDEVWPHDRLEIRLAAQGQGRRASLRATGPRHVELLRTLDLAFGCG